jgi:hypothetical protein
MSQSINKHGDHTASCWCCEHLNFEWATPDYSEYTPGDSAYITCKKKVFPNKYSPDQDDFHSLQIIGQTCSEFEGLTIRDVTP